MCQQNPYLPVSPQPAFARSQPVSLRFMAPWEGLRWLSCRCGLTQCRRPLVGGTSPSAHPKSLPPCSALTSCSPVLPRRDWCPCALASPVFKSTLVGVPRGRSSYGLARKAVPGGLAEPLEREMSDGTEKRGSLGPHSQPWVFLGHSRGGLDRGAGTLGFEMTVARTA